MSVMLLVALFQASVEYSITLLMCALQMVERLWEGMEASQSQQVNHPLTALAVTIFM